MEHRLVPAADQPTILADARAALLATLARTPYGDPDATHPDLWHGLRYGPKG